MNRPVMRRRRKTRQETWGCSERDTNVVGVTLQEARNKEAEYPV